MTVQVSAKHKMVGVPTRPDVENLFPGARKMTVSGVEHLLLPHGLTETFLLRKMGLEVPSPILTHYNWSDSVVPPFEAQRKTAALLTMNQRAYVLNGKGTGKTKTLLWAWDYLRSNNFCGKLLVIAPLSTLTFTWAHEIVATLPHRKYAVLHGSKARRVKLLNDPEPEIFIINHDGIKVVMDELSQHPDIDVLGIDELAVYRNGGSDRTKAAIKLAARMKWAWGMSGDPMPHSPTDVWAQAKIITPQSVPKYYGRFRDDLMYKIPNSDFKYLPKHDAVDRAYAVMQPALRFTLDDVVELPELVERFVDVELGAKQAKVYKEIAAKCYSAIQGHEITAANAGAAMNKLLQVSCGWVYTADGHVVPLDNDLRVKRLVDEITGAARKVLVFVPFKHALAGISDALTKEGIEHACVSGDTSLKERSDIFTAFQTTSKYKVLPVHPQCVAHGITLTAADTAIWFAPITSNETYSQANARIRRVGQKHKQLVLHLQATPVERKIYKMLQAQQNIQNMFLELFEDATPNQVH